MKQTLEKNQFITSHPRTGSQMARLIAEVTKILNEEMNEGKGKLRPAIPLIKGKKPFFEWPVVFLPKEGEAIFIGDTHGDSLAVLSVLRQEQFTEKVASGRKIYLVMLGDYADRGKEDVKNLEIILELKKQFPQAVYLLRGNHEEAAVGQFYGFLVSCITRFGYEKGQNIFQQFNDLFEKFPSVLVTANGIVAVHGGLPISEVSSLTELKNEEDLTEIRWNDPTEEIDHFVFNYRRGAEYLFGRGIFDKFMDSIGGRVLIRSHEYVTNGYKFMFAQKLLSIFSNGGTSKESGYRDFILYPKYAKVDLGKSIARWDMRHLQDVRY